MLKKHQDLLNMLLSVIKEQYADDISVLLIYGSCVNGTSHEISDLDMIFVPKTERGRNLAKTFILNGVGYDLWGTDWNRLERFANFEDMKVSVIADSQLVYYASEEDRQRYEALKSQVKSIADGVLTPDLLQKAKGHLQKAKQYYGDLCIQQNLTAAGGILMEIGYTVCLLNHSYLHYGTKKMFEELSCLERLPEHFIPIFRAVAEQPETAKENCAALIQMTQKFVSAVGREQFSTPCDLTGLYEEMVSHWNKIRFFCAKGDVMGVFMAATSLQYELDCVQGDLGVQMDELHFFDQFDPHNLQAFSIKADQAEIAFLQLLHMMNITITRYETGEQLRQSLI